MACFVTMPAEAGIQNNFIYLDSRLSREWRIAKR